MNGARFLPTLGGLVLTLAACSASIDGDGLQKTPPGPNGMAGAAGQNGGGAGAPSTSSDSRDAVAKRCEASQLPPPQLRRLTQGELERTLRDVFPALKTGWAGVRLGADPVSTLGFSNDARTLVVANQTAQELLGTAEDVATALTTGTALASVVPCAAAPGAARACVDELVKTVGARLFRRPVAADESKSYGALYDTVAAKSDFATGARWVLVALIQSPSTVYRSELGTDVGGKRQLTPSELATELSYTYGGSTPSPELLASAERGELSTAAARVAKAKELLAAPSGREQLHQFLAEWSGYGRVASKDKTGLPNFAALRASMQQETRLFLEEAVIAKQGGVRELLTANYTFVDSALAGLYGLGAAAATGAEFVRVEKPVGRGLGLLAQGSMLAGSAHADGSSPTLRGLVVYERLLCHQRVKPPANIPQIESVMTSAKTTRERYEVSHAKPGCSTCHQYFDPLGFGFEHFDAAGRYREDENGLPIDAKAQAVSFPDGSPLFSFDGLDEMTTQLAARAEVADCVSGLAAAYAFAGAGGRTCLAEDARAAFGRGEAGLLEYFAQLAGSSAFAERTP